MIITKETNLKNLSEIPCIVENGLLVIALENNEFSKFINRVLRVHSTDLDYYTEDFEFIDLIKKLDIKTFLCYHESDWGGIPIDSIRFAIIDNEIILESIRSDQLEDSEEPYLLIPTEKIDAEKILDIQTERIDYYHTYGDFIDKIQNNTNNFAQ